jgi:uncharacterized OB-fold protein
MGNIPEQLTVVKCKGCGQLLVPPKYMCPECGNSEFTEVALSGNGQILTYTTIRVPPLGFEDQVPYDIAVLQLDEGIKLTARIATQGEERPKIGDKVSFINKDRGAYWFRLAS